VKEIFHESLPTYFFMIPKKALLLHPQYDSKDILRYA